MESTINALKMKLAWQEAWRLRSCPGDDMLFTEQPTIETRRHLTRCPACSAAKTDAQSRPAWRELAHNLCEGAASLHKATNAIPVEGQVWALKDDLCHWREDGNYYRPPQVLLLGVDGNALKVAQTYHDTTLADDGDVVLTDSRFGFAQAWNIYTIHREMLDHCLGGLKHDELQAVLNESEKTRVDIDENSVLYWFRTSEVVVGAEIAMPAVARLMEEMEAAAHEVIELAPGLKLAVNGAKDFVLEIAAGTLDLLRGTFKPALVLRGGAPKSVAAKLTDEQKKMVQEHCAVVPVDMKLAGDTLTVTLKWLREKPIVLPVLTVALDGMTVSEAGFASAAEDKIIIQHPLFSNVMLSQIASLKLSFVDDTVSLQITVEQTR